MTSFASLGFRPLSITSSCSPPSRSRFPPSVGGLDAWRRRRFFAYLIGANWHIPNRLNMSRATGATLYFVRVMSENTGIPSQGLKSNGTCSNLKIRDQSASPACERARDRFRCMNLDVGRRRSNAVVRSWRIWCPGRLRRRDDRYGGFKSIAASWNCRDQAQPVALGRKSELRPAMFHSSLSFSRRNTCGAC